MAEPGIAMQKLERTTVVPRMAAAAPAVLTTGALDPAGFPAGDAEQVGARVRVPLLLGTSLIAIAMPAQEEPPVVLDMVPTVAAVGKVRLKAQRGEEMPVGWMIGRDGKPLTDPERADEGLLVPIGEYKGYGLSLIIGLLSGTLRQAAVGADGIDFVK